MVYSEQHSDGALLKGRTFDPDIEKFISTIRKRFDFSDAEAEKLSERITLTTTFDREEFLVREDERIHYSSLILDGYAARAKYNEDGSRQITQLQIPGDFVDLHSYPLEVLDHAIVALTPCTIAKLHHTDISELIDEDPRMARILWFSTMVDAAMHREWIQNIGSREGKARIAHLICEIHARSEVVGLADNGTFSFPLTQAQLGECLGFSQIHVNRLLRMLREEGYLTFKEKVVTIHKMEAFCDLANFDANYLYLSKRSS
ncbi:Crp/Fnr family transcriptional regulator [Aurantiacibacter sediminis]|uniref:Crp/Fnr family transcriptional regulator n=1 Tax=Aurantiacibacter sediminis TaxID=2793064 RepID=A0ABS0N2W4_9SPHN|nr:Crp/Fnr family transcriptional regulator [Aurantiacibacter sediminis]MBH5322310.1 Crp/Fnr family transcriptional regulator [Aurantiacibacter sediminis]